MLTDGDGGGVTERRGLRHMQTFGETVKLTDLFVGQPVLLPMQRLGLTFFLFSYQLFQFV
jgi:hypothetical protein